MQCYNSVLEALELLVSTSADSANVSGTHIYETEGHPDSDHSLCLERDICSGWTRFTPSSRGMHGSRYGGAACRELSQ